MERIAESVLECIGNTPLIRLHRIEAALGLSVELCVKYEAKNPGGSAKDRPARQMIEAAERAGEIAPDTVLIEPTSGNTGVGLAMVAAVKGYRVILTMPETLSLERQRLLAAYGAELVLTEGSLGMQGAIDRAEALHGAIPNSRILGQFSNLENPRAHYLTTGPEIWRDTDGRLDGFVATVGTGGSISGTAHFLKEQNPAIRIVGIEPSGSPVLSGGTAGPHNIQGIGAGFVPATLDTGCYDELLTITDDAAYEMTRRLARTEGLLVGISAGAAVAGAAVLAARPAWAGKRLVVLLPDTGERYLSTGVFSVEG